MKPLQATFAILFACILSIHGYSQEKFSSVRVFPPADSESFARLIGELDIDHYYFKGGGMMVELGRMELAKLRELGIKYEIVVDDVYAEVRKQNEKYFADRAAGRVPVEQPGGVVGNIIAKPSAFVVQPTFGGYYSFAQMEQAMLDLANAYPSIVSRISLGTSIEGRTIWVVKISDNVGTDEASEPDILYLGLQHAREAITGASMIFFMQYLAEQYGTNPNVTQLVNNREFYIVPCMNPDGWEFNRVTATGVVNQIGGGQRKNRRNVGTDVMGTGTSYYSGSQKGVDLNRNWSVDWANCSAPIQGAASSCGSSSTSSPTYYGSAAFSEPETQAIRGLVIAAGKNFVAGFDQHSYGPYYSLPYGRRSLHTGGLPLLDSLYLYTASSMMGQYNGMRANDSYGALGYEVAGGFKDWMLMGEIGTGSKIKAYGITGEGAAGGGTSGTNGSFWAPAGEIINLCKGMCYQNLQLAYTAGSYVDIQDIGNIGLTSLSGNLPFEIRRVGLQNSAVTVTLIPLENISSVGSPVNIASLPNYYDTYSGNISYTLPGAMTNGQRIKYAWKVETGGLTYYDTIVKFYNPTTLLTDNMEGTLTTNWTNIVEGTVASGFGYNYVAGDWVFTASGGYGGSGKALSESAAGTNYATRAIRILQYNATFDLSDATAAYLTFFMRHRAENFRDKLRVEASSDGSTWIPLDGSSTVREPGTLDDATIDGKPSYTGIQNFWVREVIDLGATFNGTPNLRLRFHFTADDDPSTFVGETDDGFYIDNLTVIKSTIPLTTLPVTLVSFSGIHQSGMNKLMWTVENESSLKEHVLERSSDGIHFTPVTTLSARNQASQFTYTYSDPVNSNATAVYYYRVKSVEIDGGYRYSKVVVLQVNGKKLLEVLNNPFGDQVVVGMYLPVSGKVSLNLYDSKGRLVSKNNYSGQQGSNTFIVDNTGSLAAGTYFLEAIHDQQKFSKTIIKK